MAFFNNKRKDFSIQPPRQQVDGTPFFVTDSANIDFTLENLNLTANLTLTGVTSGTYGSPTLIPILEVDQWGRITGVTTTPFSASGITLQTNNVNNASQILLNLIAGANITLSNSGGNVTISASGTGGPATWGSITGTVTDQTDLITYLTTNYYPLTGNPSGFLTTISGIAAGGDLSGTYPDPTVAKLRGEPISTTAPTIGKILQYNGTEWAPANIPSGGSGGGGVFYYFNYQNTTNISPTTGLPTTPVPPSQLGIIYDAISNSINSANLTQGVYTLVCGFVTIVGTPGITDIPAGLWDFNIWADVVGGAGGSSQTQFQIRVYKYDSSGAGTYTLLATSDDIFIYDPSVIAQYIGNVTIPQTTLLVTDRIYIEFWAQKSVNQSRQISFHFGTNTPSHVHTTIPSVTGTGLVKVVNSVYQSPATLLFNADVDTNAAIAVSKLSMSTDRLLGRTTAGTGAVEEIQLTTNLTSGPATLLGGILNIPQYSGGPGGNSIEQLTSLGDVTTPAATAPSQGVTATLDPNYKEGGTTAIFDGGGSLIINGKIAYVRIPYKGTITGWFLAADQLGSCSIAVKQGLFSPFPPTTTIITAALSGTQTLSATVSLPVAAGDWFSFTISGVATITWVNLTLTITKTL